MSRIQRGRPRSFDREQALWKALFVFWSLGYEGASLTDLTRAMGINSPSLYSAFHSKEALFREAVELYRTTIGSGTVHALKEETSARQAIESALRATVRMFSSRDHPSGCLIVLGTMACSEDSREVQEHLRQFRLKTPELIRQCLERGIEAGDVLPETDIDSVAQYYTTVLHGLSIQARDGASDQTMMRIVDCAMTAWAELMGKSKN